MLTYEQYKDLQRKQRIYWTGGAMLGIGVVEVTMAGASLRKGKVEQYAWVNDAKLTEAIYVSREHLFSNFDEAVHSLTTECNTFIDRIESMVENGNKSFVSLLKNDQADPRKCSVLHVNRQVETILPALRTAIVSSTKKPVS